MKHITAVVVVLLSVVGAHGQALRAASAGIAINGHGSMFDGTVVTREGHGILLGAPAISVSVDPLNGGFARLAQHSMDNCVDPGMIRHVDPSIDPGIVSHVSTPEWTGATPEMVVIPSPEFRLPGFNLYDFKGAIPLPDGTLDLKPGDTLRVNGPNLNRIVPLPNGRVSKP